MTDKTNSEGALAAQLVPAEYTAAIEELAQRQSMTPKQVLMAAIRLYQAECNGTIKVTPIDFGPLAAAPQAPAVPDGVAPDYVMTNQRAAFFLERFKREEKLLGPHEQMALAHAISALEAAQPAPQAPLTADDLREPKNGTAWRVEWWNENARLMLPADAKLDSFQSYRNGTLMFTIKKASAAGVKEAHDASA